MPKRQKCGKHSKHGDRKKRKQVSANPKKSVQRMAKNGHGVIYALANSGLLWLPPLTASDAE